MWLVKMVAVKLAVKNRRRGRGCRKTVIIQYAPLAQMDRAQDS